MGRAEQSRAGQGTMQMLAVISLSLPLILPPLLILILILFVTHKIKHKRYSSNSMNLPPGSLGWPVVGESLAFLRAGKGGSPESFITQRMEKYGHPPVFKTSLMGEPMAVFGGPAGNKFLFGNENKLVAVWWPVTVRKLFGSCMITTVGGEGMRMKKMMMGFVGPEALLRYIKVMDEVTLHHIQAEWEGKKEVKVYPTVKLYTFELACRLFMSIEDPQLISKLSTHFNVFLKGIIELPINLPGTRFYRAMKAADVIRKELQVIVRERRIALRQSKASPTQDLLSHLLVNADENQRFMTEIEIINNILTLLFAGHDTSSSTITLIVKYLAQLPQVYENVYTEQMNIASSKAPREPLKWEDIQNMRYSWNVIAEVMRIMPPVSGAFREALVDFTYEGYTIPKGWKLYWSSASTHKDPNMFPKATSFDVSRFEGAGPAPFSYVPFGGGPRMCLGKEFARIEMLVFLHNIVKRYRWELAIPNEKIIYDPMPTPLNGLPVSLQPLH